MFSYLSKPSRRKLLFTQFYTETKTLVPSACISQTQKLSRKKERMRKEGRNEGKERGREERRGREVRKGRDPTQTCKHKRKALFISFHSAT